MNIHVLCRNMQKSLDKSEKACIIEYSKHIGSTSDAGSECLPILERNY